MSRDLTEAVIAQTEAAQVETFLLFEGDFVSGTIRAWSGYGDLVWNNETWTGTGTLLSVSNVTEDNQVSAKGVNIVLDGIPPELISVALQSCRQGADGRIYLGFMSANQVVSDPLLLFEGKLDVPVINEGAEASNISISYESRLIDLLRPRESRFTDEDQKREFPGDLGCEFVISLQDKSIKWGGS
jgi:hypothetical protein